MHKKSKKKQRLDILLTEKNFVQSRQRAKALIMAGKVFVEAVCVDKPGANVATNAKIEIKGGDLPYVSRGGLKLEKALDKFNVCVKDLNCLDIGASTGGFTDCLLQNGAKHVFAVDVGYGQIAWKLRNDSRVTVIERTNIRYMPQNTLPCLADICVIDVSFISLKIVIPAALKFLKNTAGIIALVKPQFEAGKKDVPKGGVIKDPALHKKIINDFKLFCKNENLICKNMIPSPIEGAKGNREFLAEVGLKKFERIL